MESRASDEILALVQTDRAQTQFQELHWTGTFREYLDMVAANPRLARNAYQRMWDMIVSHGVEDVTVRKEKIQRYPFFADPIGGGRDAVFGCENALMRLVAHLRAAAAGYGSERRILLLHGPVGSAKSTIARLQTTLASSQDHAVKMAICEYAADLITAEQRTAAIIAAVRDAPLLAGLHLALRQLAQFHPSEISTQDPDERRAAHEELLRRLRA